MMGGAGGMGGFGGALVGMGTQALGESISNVGSWWHARQLNKKARSDWRKSLQRGPTYWRQGLERAGINPIYAFSGGGPGGAGTALNLQQQAPGAKGGGAGSQFASQLRASKLADKELEVLQSQQDLNAANTATRVGEIAQAKAEAAYWLTPEGIETAKEGARREAMGLNTFHGAMVSALFSALEREQGNNARTAPEIRALKDWFLGEHQYKDKKFYDIFTPGDAVRDAKPEEKR